MNNTLPDLTDAIIAGHTIDAPLAQDLASQTNKEELYKAADTVRRTFMGNHFDLCSIINAKSGNCTENCRFCAQSARHKTGIDTYKLIDSKEALTIADDNDKHGVHRLSLVTSGRNLNKETLDQLCTLYHDIAETSSMHFCTSAGFLTKEIVHKLAASGVTRYHCNLEANRDFFPQICTTHTWEEKVQTLTLARESGLSLCSGGIIGLGETMEDRIALALELKELDVRSIPINILTPIPGTPLEQLQPLTLEEVLTTIALFRLINPKAVIRMAGGRQQLGKEQYQCFSAGANGAIVGNYLTTTGSGITEDKEQLSSMGFEFTKEEACHA